MKVKNILIILIIALISIINCKEEKQSDKQNSDEFTMFTEEIGSTQTENIPILENSCSVDKVGNKVSNDRKYIFHSSATIKIEGWAADIKNITIPKDLVIELKGTKIYSLKIYNRLDRSDVVKYFQKPELLGSGFESNDTFIKNIELGEYDVNIIQYVGMNTFKCDPKVKLTIIADN